VSSRSEPLISVDRLRGTAVRGRLQLDERSINELLHVLSPQRNVTLRLSANNRILVQVGSFHANATLGSRVWLSPTPRVLLRLDSLLVATGLRALAPQPLVTVRGREVEIDVAAVPGLDAARDWLSHLSSLDIVTAPAMVQLQFVWRLED